jgi:methylglyoxal synthase
MDKFDLAITADVSKRMELINLVNKYQSGFNQLSIVATKNSGIVITELTGLTVHILDNGPNGGYLQMGKLVADNDVRMVIFLQDAAAINVDELGIRLLLSACSVRNVPFANNLKTAEFILHRYLEIKMASIWRCSGQVPASELSPKELESILSN